MFRRIFALILSLLQLCLTGVFSGAKPDRLAVPTPAETVQDIRGSYPLADTVVYASQAANAVQGYYTDFTRSAYALRNRQSILSHTLRKGAGTAALTDLDGHAYFAGTFDAFYTENGQTRYAGTSPVKARVNTIRLGLYAYETHVRDQNFGTDKFMLDKAFYAYPDALYAQFDLYAVEAASAPDEVGAEIRIPTRRVAAIRVRDANGIHDDPAAADENTTEYAALDIRGVGLVGFILPPDSGRAVLTREKNDYVLRLYAAVPAGSGVNKYDGTGSFDLDTISFGCRVWTDTAHDFAALDRDAYAERHPLEGVSVEPGSADARLLGYNALRGTYDIAVASTDFTAAYNDPDRHYRAPVAVTADKLDRTVWLRVVGTSGCLEAAALLDENNESVPVPMQVNKNFHGDYGEPDPLYYTFRDTAYGESLSPLAVSAGQTLRCTVVHAYQNWGKVPLKQLSAIEYHRSYYHLSTGVTETNCIAPYFVNNRNGWLLPDFRGRSGVMWPEQPQFNSVGRLFLAQSHRLGLQIPGEYLTSRIDCVGQTYADISTAYIADTGDYAYTLRHTEFPQTDENRTYYSLDLRFEHTSVFADFRREFDLFRFDGRGADFEQMGYLDRTNTLVHTDTPTGTHFFPLGDDGPYFSFYHISDATKGMLEERFGSSFALLVRDVSVRRNGKDASAALCLRTESTDEETFAALTLDTGAAVFRPGDEIRIDFILMPWGTGLETHDDNALAVREDSALQRVRLTAQTGTVIDDAVLPHLRCENNTAQFTLTGGRNNIAVRVDGFTQKSLPVIERQTVDGWQRVVLASANGYDGYTVHYNADGTYGFSFVYTAETPEDVHIFRMAQ